MKDLHLILPKTYCLYDLTITSWKTLLQLSFGFYFAKKKADENKYGKIHFEKYTTWDANLVFIS